MIGNGIANEINDALTNLDDNLMYDPKTDNWTSMDPMSIRIGGFVADSLNGEIYICIWRPTEALEEKLSIVEIIPDSN
jgi:N-acetylneuraminic acid mutarotase